MIVSVILINNDYGIEVVVFDFLEGIMVHTFVQNGYYMAVDGNSGTVHVLDQLSYAMLENQEELQTLETYLKKFKGDYASKDIEEVYLELAELVEKDLLYTSLEEIEEFYNQNTAKLNTNIKSFCLHIAHDCNLRCEYCFASEGDYNLGKALMSKEVAIKAVDYLVEHSEGRKKIEVDFFGGEPLMNFGVVEDVVNYGRQIEKETNKEFYFTMTTNGTLLSNYRSDFINKEMDNVVISIDGRKEVHDRIRHGINKSPSYDRIVAKAQKLISERDNKSYFVRGTFTSYNKDFSEDVMHLADLGFKEISVEPVVGEGKDLFFKEEDLPDIMEEYDRLARRYIDRIEKGKPFRFYHFNIDLDKGPCLFKKVAACGAGYEYMAVSPEGDLYPCHQFVGIDEFKIGTLDKGVTNPELCQKFQDNTIFAKDACRDCWAKFYCSGGCHANAYFSNEDIGKPNEMTCILQKKRIECALMVNAWRSSL